MMSDLQQNKSWSDEIIHLYSEGNFDVEVASELKVSIREFYRQMEANESFKRLVEYGRTLCEAYWVHQAKKNLNNKTFNSSTWMFVMKNKFNWADKSEQVQSGDNSGANLDELRQQLQSEVKRYLKQYEPELQSTYKELKLVNE